MFKRIPFWIITLLALVSISIVFWIISGYILPNNSTIKDKVDFIAIPILVISAILLAIQISIQNKQNYIEQEVLNQPYLAFKCACSQDHDFPFNPQNTKDNKKWILFYLSNVGKMPAKNVGLYFLHSSEQEDSICGKHLNYIPEIGLPKQFSMQVFMDKDEFSQKIEKDKKQEENYFVVLVQYQSSITNTVYKKIYHLWYCDEQSTEPPNPTQIEHKNQSNKQFYASTVISASDSYNISLKDWMSNLWFKILLKLRIKSCKNNYTIEEWLKSF